tara:strand:+ start:351 stop:641 length:291 start_codon:yes stop_codon:yes gene_type:complete
MSKGLKGFDLLAYMFVRANAESWAEALSFTPNRSVVMEELRKDLPHLNKLIPDDDKAFLQYLNEVMPKEIIIEKHKSVEGQSTEYNYDVNELWRNK